jgi:hypothetical protein
MSIVVWDGKTLAADMQATCADARFKVSKMRRLDDGTVLAWAGHQDGGLAMARWYETGADPNKLPPCQKDEWTRLIVVQPGGKVVFYEQFGYPIEVLDCPAAWGSGRDFALGALAMGADARRAVEIACQFNINCGMGVEAIDVAPSLPVVSVEFSRVSSKGNHTCL